LPVELREAIVIAAGAGSRLRPLTDRWPKPVLPIDGRPVIGTLLRELAAAELTAVTVVVGHLGAQVRALVGDGSAFGVSVGYAEQPEPLGSADAVRRAVAAGAGPPFAVSAADTVYRPGAIAAAAEEWTRSGAPAGIGVRAVPREELGQRTGVRVVDGRLVALGEAGEERLAAAPLWFLGPSAVARLADVPGPPYELRAALDAALESGDEVAALPVGPTRDITRPADVVAANFPYLERRGS